MVIVSSTLKHARQAAGLTQQQLADQLNLSQAYWALLETGKRRLSTGLVSKVVRILNLRPTALPVDTDAEGRPATSESLAKQLGAIGYPGFAYHHQGRKRNPAAVLLSALLSDDLETRVVEALPWLVLEYADLDWDWLLGRAKLGNVQNRLGFVVSLARDVAVNRGSDSATLAALAGVASRLERSRLVREDTLCQEFLSAAERTWLRKTRSPAAAHWNLLTDLRSQSLPYAA